jgi:hypothetical protein
VPAVLNDDDLFGGPFDPVAAAPPGEPAPDWVAPTRPAPAAAPAPPAIPDPDDFRAEMEEALRAAGQPFRIADEGAAAWAVELILGKRAAIERLKAQFADLHRERLGELERAEAYFLPLLEEWMKAQDLRGKKSVKLLTGTLATKLVRGGPKLVDETVALEWAEIDYPGCVRRWTVPEQHKVAIDKDALFGHILDTGELVPGVELVPDRVAFRVDAPKTTKQAAASAAGEEE